MSAPHIPLQPPPPFNFKSPDEWSRWRRRFEQFRVASGLAESSAAKQVSTLLYRLGEEADCVLTSVNATADDRKVYAKVLELFDDYFKVRRNVIFERARFNRRVKLPGETAEEFIMTLYTLAATCNYGDLEQEMIRDRLVVGIRDSALSETLQTDAKLTLEAAKTKIRQREVVHEQQRELKGAQGGKPSNLDNLQSRRRTNYSDRRRESNHPRETGEGRPRDKQCTRCRKGQHPREKCQARDATCYKCQQKGHYSSQCRSKTVAPVTVEGQSNLESTFLDAASTPKGTAWFADIQLSDQETLTFKLDTGAEVTAISDSCYQSLSHQPPLNTPDKVLYGPSHKPLQVRGQCYCYLSFNGRSSKQQVFVVDGLNNNLLGLPAITSLKLAKRLDETVTTAAISSAEILKRFPKLFTGLGNLGNAYEIKLKPDAVPHALYTSRNVPIPLRAKVTEELNRMEEMGVISKVEEPTEWCAGMVVVPKKTGAVRICVDLKPLNTSVRREVHPLPKVDDTLAQLTGARFFSKLDANSGFWQIPLSSASRLLTTFITPSGRYCFNKLPFGIASAPEHFQKRMNAILHGLDGVLCLMDDVLVFGRDQEEHNQRLLAALKKIEAAGATLNAQKCEFG